MILSVLRGIAKLTAAATGLLLDYGVVYTMEGMTTRIPMNRWHELAITTLWMLPWTLLICSGLEDFSTVIQKAWAFWLGASLAVVLLYYFERNTTSTVLTKAAMPLLAVTVGLLPHTIPRIRFVFAVFGLAAGLAGVGFLYIVLPTIISPMSHFASWEIGVVMVAFGASALATGILTAVPFCQRIRSRVAAR